MLTTNTAVNNINLKHTVQYSDRLAELDSAWGGFTVDELDASSIFINGNYANTKNKTAEAFAKKFIYTSVDDDACPVLLYLRGDCMVAWYEEELGEGYIA